MLKNKKMLRFFGLLAGLAVLVIVWLVVIQPLTRSNNRDELALNNDQDTSTTTNDPLGDATIVDTDDNDRPAVSDDNQTEESTVGDSDQATTGGATGGATGNIPDELAVSGATGFHIASILGLVAVTYLFFLNRRMQREVKLAKSLTREQR